ncbi:hypothetical protein J5J10_10900 [Ciceribacter sp. L1K23]|uniref:hypothetical protein n=1 Tax=Ciceribacter sp. L1K23 TaxID=2820276 RepID=UPI001B83B86A|nr:hypothetical protein [Ciceribacter sp. L1K23]MBR0556185.1 hypothetical protein [Ciceribacter sp. L1K23]
MAYANDKLGYERPWGFALAAVLGSVVLILIDVMTKQIDSSLVRESGGLELATALLFGYTAVVWLWTRSGDEWRVHWQLPAVMLMMMGRELDLDKKLTSIGLLQSKLYFSAEAPMMERILGIVVIAVTITIVVRLLRYNAGIFIEALRSRTPWAWGVVAAIALGVVSTSLDGIDRKLAPLGISIDPALAAKAALAEEFLELLIPLLLLAATLSSFILRRLRHQAAQRTIR